MKKLIILITILFCLVNISAKEFYVGLNGSDTNIGTKEKPFLNIEFGLSKLNDNDTLIILEGTYYIENTIVLKSNITVKAFEGHEVILKNLTKPNPNEWIQVSEKLWKIKSKDSIIQLFIDEKPYFTASYPTINENINALKQGEFAIAYPNKEIYVKGLEKFKNISNAKFLSIHGISIISLSGDVISQNKNVIKIKSGAFPWKEEFRKEYLDTGKIILYGLREFLDDNQEWFYEDGELIIQLNENPKNRNIEIRKNLYTFDCSNQKNINISNITIKCGNFNLNNSENCIIENCNIYFTTPIFSFLDGFEKFNTHYDENNNPWFVEPINWTGKGVTISGQRNTLKNCFIAHSWGDGLTVWGKNNIIENNIIFDCNWIGNDCANLTVTGQNQLVKNNTIYQTNRSLIVHRELENGKILNNHLYENGILCEDLGMTATYFSDGKNTEIAYNYLHDSKAKIRSHGIYLDNWNKNFNVHHNIIKNCLTGIQINTPTENINISNNTLVDNKFSFGSWGAINAIFSNVKTHNNITNSNIKTKFNAPFYGTQIDSNYVYLDNPIFIDPLNNNFQLKKNSYPIDKGINNEFTKSFEGKLPDLGAIEFGTIPWNYGSSLIVPNEKYYPPRAPLNLILLKNTFDTTLFEWNYPFQMVDSFYVERKKSTENNYSIIARIPSTRLIFNDANQPPGEYRYQVRAVNQYGISEPSNSIQIFNPITNNSLYFDAEDPDLQYGTKAVYDLVGELDNKDWICFNDINLDSTFFDACMLNMAVPCEFAWQEIQVRLDDPMGRMIGKFRPPSTGGWDIFKMYSFPIEKIKGTHNVYFRFKGEYAIGTIDWFTFYDSNGEVKESIPYDSLCPFPSLKNREVKMRVFPNPVYKEINLTLDCQEKSTLEVEVFDTKGVVYYSNTFENLLPGTVEIPLHDDPKVNNLLPGVYMVKAHITSKKVDSYSMMKFIKTNE